MRFCCTGRCSIKALKPSPLCVSGFSCQPDPDGFLRGKPNECRVNQNGHKEEEIQVSGSLLVRANQPWLICSCWQLQLPLSSGGKQEECVGLTHWETSHFSPDQRKNIFQSVSLGPVHAPQCVLSSLSPLFIFNESMVDCSQPVFAPVCPSFL